MERVWTEDRDSIENVASELRNELELKGLHFHLGTQVEDPKYYEKAIDKTIQTAKEIGVEIKMLDIGGGYPAQYTERDIPLEEYGRRVGEKVDVGEKGLVVFNSLSSQGDL